MSRSIEIVEVGPRDGLQNEKTVISTEDKIELINRLEAAGSRRLETVSFVHPGRVPQMADAEAVMAGLALNPDVTRIGLVLNVRGWDRAVETGVDQANVSIAASDGFALKNAGLTVAQQVEMLGEIVGRSHNMGGAPGSGPAVTAIISTVWGCPFDGEVSDDQVAAVVRDVAALGVQEIGLADTIGVGDPWAVRRKIEVAKKAAPDATLRLHFHDTRNTAMANIFAGVEAGIDVIDASVGGIGGCPFAPGATGNVATEDVVYMLGRAGFETGYDLDALIETARWIGERIGRSRPSALSRAGGWPKT
ncbi:MAG TPA: hydroxymethylglutaryl-CoA lyase [Brevundimonas sp.]|jgi:hydroxymethylglutaryl-CoA lyase|uniref:hydroxymethylglutaryl-CoA lyase n=1 Tax=Brevundimonas sp. TaxID=1871086 RepID=UPI002BCC33F9|nr:hydroxymethylglutaryl-CoA lyase [Brevundimonas sp.]HRH19041.1 hydroxymethylglutaryl-CoA lyase [Brevundimonas sp.]